MNMVIFFVLFIISEIMCVVVLCFLPVQYFKKLI